MKGKKILFRKFFKNQAFLFFVISPQIFSISVIKKSECKIKR
jgi:hypothetical protein